HGRTTSRPLTCSGLSAVAAPVLGPAPEAHQFPVALIRAGVRLFTPKPRLPVMLFPTILTPRPPPSTTTPSPSLAKIVLSLTVSATFRDWTRRMPPAVWVNRP